jgi:hypothetical protein
VVAVQEVLLTTELELMVHQTPVVVAVVLVVVIFNLVLVVQVDQVL